MQTAGYVCQTWLIPFIFQVNSQEKTQISSTTFVDMNVCSEKKVCEYKKFVNTKTSQKIVHRFSSNYNISMI